MKQFKIVLAALLAFALVPLLPNNALACNGQGSTASAKPLSATAFAPTVRNVDAAIPSAIICASNPAPASAFEQPAATKPKNGRSFAKTADSIELLHGTFSFATGVALVIASVALENNRRH